MNNVVRIFFIFVLVLAAGFAVRANAVSWSPEAVEHEEKAAKGIKTAGDTVCLFQSGTQEVKNIIHIGDILPVYRENRDHAVRLVGRVRILSFEGEDYLKAEVVDGELMTGDVAKKEDMASLLLSSGDKCQKAGK